MINYLLVLAVPLAAVSFAWAGFLYITAAGDSGKVEEAKGIFKKVAIGFIIALAGYLIVKTITFSLLKDAPSVLG